MASNMSYNSTQNPSNHAINSGQEVKHLTQEELRVIRECRRESFYYRCIPLSTLFSGLAYIGIKNGYLKAHPKYGYFPKVFAGTLLGFFVGKMSYQSVVARRLMALPNSVLGERLRQQFGRHINEYQKNDPLLVTQTAPSAEFQESAPIFDDRRPDLSEHSEGMDSYDSVTESLAPYSEVTNDSHSSKPLNSYDDLRQENRREYLGKVAEKYRRQSPEPIRSPDTFSELPPLAPSDPVSLPPPSSPSYKPAEPYFNRKKNKYGDVWEETS